MNTKTAFMPDTRREVTSRWWQVLVLPWRAHDRGRRRFMAATLILALILMVLLATVLPVDHVAAVGTVLGITDAVLWFYFLPACLLLVYSGRDLRTPDIQRAVAHSLLAYLIVTWFVPALVMSWAWAGGDPLVFVLGLLLVCAGAFLLSVLPGWMGMALMISPSVVMLGLGQLFDLSVMTLPDVNDPGFTANLGLWAGATVLLAVARWRQLCSQPAATSRWRRATIYNILITAHINASANTELTLIRQRASWMQPEAQLAGTGPGHFARSLRVALGGSWLPVTLRTAWRHWALSIATITLSFGFLSLIVHSDAKVQHDLVHLLFLVCGSAALLGIFLGIGTLPRRVQQRWSRVNGELSLLALLPHLDPGTHVKNDVLRTCLRRPLLQLSGVLLVVWLLVSWIEHGFNLFAAAVFADMAIVVALMIVAFTLAVLGHARLHTLVNVIMGLLLGLLIVATGGYFLATQLHAAAPSSRWLAALGMGWTMVQLISIGLIIRAWRRWQNLPHAFLATGTE